MSIEKLIEMSHKYGKNPDFVLAGGGNTSYKDNEYLYVKCSGTTLGELSESGIAKLERNSLNVLWTKEYAANDKEREEQVLIDLMKSRAYGEEHKRPSVETMLHNLFPQSYVLHTHPALINGLTCSKNGKDAMTELFTNDAIWVELEKPGFVLAIKVKEKLDDYKTRFGKDANIVFLQNHGIFVAANSTEEIDSVMSEIVRKINEKIIEIPDFSDTCFDRETAIYLAPVIRMCLMDNTSIVTFRTNKEVMKYLQDN